MLTDYCIYTIKHSSDLIDTHRKGGRDTYTERTKWVKGKELLDEARKTGKRLPVIFAPAEGTFRLFGWALLEDVVLGGGTTYSFSALRLFEKQPPKSSLRKAKDGKRLDKWFIRPYAICRTPTYLADCFRKRIGSGIRHFISYHNAERMGYSFEDSNPFSVVTKKAVNHLIGAKVWSIAGVGQPREYCLGSWFIVDEVGSSAQEQFDQLASGRIGEVFDPLVPLNRLPWFPRFRKSQSNFSLGLQPIKDEFVGYLEALAWEIGPKPLVAPVFPDEVDAAEVYREGAVRRVSVNAYERNPVARHCCIRHYGTSCFICGFNFGSAYGEVVEGLIHVHHLRPLSQVGEEYAVDPVADLRPVCPNCHAVLHSRTPAYSIEEVATFLRGRRRTEQSAVRDKKTKGASKVSQPNH